MTNAKLIDIQPLNTTEFDRHTDDELTLQSPASILVTDCRDDKALKLSVDLAVDSALSIMRNAHIAECVVLDPQGKLAGMISLTDLQSAKVLSTANRLGLHRSDLTLKDVMYPKAKLQSINLFALSRANVNDLLNNMQRLGAPYVIVINAHENEICGYVSAREASKRLNHPVHINAYASGLKEVLETVDHPH